MMEGKININELTESQVQHNIDDIGRKTRK